MGFTKRRHALETHKLFPYVACGLTALSVFFVYQLVTDLQAATAKLQAQTDRLQEQVQADPRTTDFDSYNINRPDAAADQ